MQKFLIKRLSVILLIVSFTTTFAQNQILNTGKKSNIMNETVLVSQQDNQTTIRFELNELELMEVVTEYGNAFIATSSKAPLMLEKGSPEIIYMTSTFIIPDRGSSELQISYGDFQDFENIEIAPSKGSLPRNIDPNRVPFEKGDVYWKDNFFPNNLASLREPFIMRDVRGQSVDVYPVQYNPVTKVLRVYSEITVTVFNNPKVAGINEFTNQKRHKTIEPQFNEMYKNFFINHTGVLQHRGYPTGEEGELLIICHTPWVNDMKPYIDWKRSIGRKTTIVPTSEISPLTAANIKTYISNFYNNPENNLAFVLFVGDHPQIPGYNAPGALSDVEYGKITGNDNYLEILIGRFSAETPAHVQTQVERTIYYERDLTTEDNWLNVGIGVARNENGYGPYHPNGHDGGENDYVHMDNIRTKMLANGYTSVSQDYDGNCPGIPNTTAALINQHINAGASVLNYCNHGFQTGWSVANYSTTHITQLQNVGMLPFQFLVACNNGEFNYSTPCFAEVFMRHTYNNQPAGAIALFGATISIAWTETMTAQDEFVNITLGIPSPYSGAQPGTKRTIAGAMLNASQKMIMVHGSGCTSDYNSWLVFGDPTLMYRTQTPQEMTISHMPIIFIGMDNLIVECDTDGATAAVTYIDEDEEVIILGTAVVENGEAQIIFNEIPAMPMDLTLTVTGFNKIPYINEISVLPPDRPFIVLQSFNLPENADYGKTIAVNLELKNVSFEPFAASNVVMNVSTESPHISFPQQTFTLGNIDAGEIFYFEDELLVTIAENVPDEELIVLNLLITGEYEGVEYEWEAVVKFFAYAPTLQITDVYIENQYGTKMSYIDPNIGNSIVIKLSNFGKADLDIVNLAVSTISQYLNINANTAEFDVLERENTVTAKIPLTTVGNAPQGNPIYFAVRASSGAFSTQEVKIIPLKNPLSNFMANGSLTVFYVNFFDSGGKNGNYKNNENLKLTFNPLTPDNKINIRFSMFNTYDEDIFSVYDGTVTTEEFLLGEFSGNDLPPDFEATNQQGNLTFTFKSTTNPPQAGWEAIIFEQIPYYNITFVVEDEDGPITNPKIIFDGYVLAKNQFDVAWVQAGQYQYNVTIDGYDTFTGTVTVGNEDVTEYVIFSNTQTYTVTFIVIDEDGEEIGDATILFNGSELTRYSCDNVPNGEYEYIVSKEGYKDTEGILTVEDANWEETVILIKEVGINAHGLSNLHLYPNPFKDIIYIEGNRELVNRVYISNMLGQTIQEVNLQGKTSFSTRDLPKGVYMINFEGFDKSVEFFKMIKQ